MSEVQDEELGRRVAAAMTATPYVASLGIVIEQWEPDDVVVRLPFREDLTNDGKAYHGGVVAAVIDTAGAAAAFSGHDFSRGMRASTVALTVQYVRAAQGEDLLVRARTVRRARELVFTEMTASVPSGDVVAHAVQTYRIAP